MARCPGTMRCLHLVLLTVLLCSGRALSLQCYLCTGTQPASQCSVISCEQGSVCYKGNLISTLQDGQKIKMNFGACAPSCEQASQVVQTSVNTGHSLGPLAPKFEVQGFSCCASDLCNGVARAGRSLWALAGGLLLSLGPALLWALL